MIDVIIGIVQNTITPVLTALVLALLGMLFAWLAKKYHLEVKQADQQYIEGVATRAISFAEEEAAAFAKAHGSKLPSDTKLSDAVTFLLRAVPALSQADARDLVSGMLGKVKGAGATGDKAVSASGFFRIQTVLLMAMLPVLLFLFSSCAGTVKGNTVAGYEATGTILTTLEANAKAMCGNGQISPDKCAGLKSLYNKTRSAYITSGDLLIAAVDATDPAAKQNALTAYQRSFTDFSTLLPELLETASDLGIKGVASK